jgi:energy-coupling factor transporter ATP-binding protein EcfA2
MILDNFQHSALNNLCSTDQLELLDSIDNLRSQGISHYVSLPQIIVCGDQSSGKSSVLEALSGVSFPVKSNLCTRFPIEIVLRKTQHASIKVSIVPHQSRSESERAALTNFHEKLDGFDGLPNLIDKATNAMMTPFGSAFSMDLLRIEISGPDHPQLTLVDLPGLIHSPTKQQSAADVKMVRDLVMSYMKEPRSIILAVVSAKNDYANQIVLNLAQRADKAGIRTLGIITKPDALIAGSQSEFSFLNLARNQDVQFRLGWHVLKNMDSETGKWSLEQRNQKEVEFFAQGTWNQLPKSAAGIETLRRRLSKILVQQIAAELPSLIEEIDSKCNICSSDLEKLGYPRATEKEQRYYLIQISQSLQQLVKAAVDGIYTNPFFEEAKSADGYRKRIRAVVQNQNMSFAESMTIKGHHYEIVDSGQVNKSIKGRVRRTRDDLLSYIQELMRKTKGRELPRMFNPMIVADLFREQSTPWETLSRKHIEDVWTAVKDFLNVTLAFVADQSTSKALFSHLFESALVGLLKKMHKRAEELLRSHQKGHPITYNHYFTENLYKIRQERMTKNITEAVAHFFDVQSTGGDYIRKHNLDLTPLITALTPSSEPDMDRAACVEALDSMLAYYEVK